MARILRGDILWADLNPVPGQQVRFAVPASWLTVVLAAWLRIRDRLLRVT